MKIGNHVGFTLVEVMIVVVIIGILAAIAYPGYNDYILKTNRTAAQSEMLDVASKLQRYKALNSNLLKNNAAVTLADFNHNGAIPQTGTKLYSLELANVTAGEWTLIATPDSAGRQKQDGIICLNHLGQRYWEKGQTACDFSKNKWS
ncbi:pilus assembly protein PilE [Acinetobacter gyllenbergii]|uniref:Prepilin-type N-terminal cleavage/methylation domain-containing protein n=1 Tax=Acinetobacter gyllenbergii CIP 110306 = MTCC 11365 TaxID=1217657 RepID=A0A829HLI5_9GAMM|nr:type IV pilin protein [Acinetobacter gyllenbergii]EPF93073.1 hypothetical protein F957_00419 [Acinetobacter gyllenbergii CIP 110306 = MTCC 11365]EPH31383.1 Type IV pilin PilA [Acinetobacter gyllenbergii CIP 110306 = MTCC 11365]ESK36747.1 hypothetical protein F987_03560 [Acinetobacter gyllenbergii NIPH 230]MCU4579694.1 prepilin-type N-terminal cleavage/methylation domain-containing protein [Acinetobacter gyllenbergii]GMA10185.1 pilus assembly protein PilE [Acinetobacter gyllenbergii]